MLTIRHKTGALAGTTQQVETTSGRVTFGRDSAFCDVVFPIDEALVAHRHFALVKKPSGDWTFDLFGKPFVAMNGAPVDEAEAVRSGAIIALGRHGGPSFVIELANEVGVGAGPITQTQEKVQGSHSAAARARRYGLAGLLLAIAAGGGAVAVYSFARSEGTRLNEAVANLSEEQKRAAAQTISSDVKEKLTRAAYLVIKKFANGTVWPAGTATPIAPDLLGTNAHVAEIFLKKKPDERVFVRAPGHDGAVYEVIEARKHPAYDALAEFLKKDPFFVVGIAGRSRLSSSNADSYDVGTLRVSPGSNISPVLELAGREELARLAPGFPLALAGYPMENIAGSEVQALAPTPTLQVGIVTAMTDMFNVPADFEHSFLVHNNVPATGGASGSPMVGPSGRIVAFHNAGNKYFVGNARIPNAAMALYAQRADMLGDLLTGDGSAVVEAQRAYWSKMTAAFRRGIDYLIPRLLASLKPKDGMTAEPVSREKFVMTAADKTTVKDDDGASIAVRIQKRTVNVTAGRQYVFIGYADEARWLNMYLRVADKVVAKDAEHEWYPHLAHTAEQDGSVELFLMSADENVAYTLFQYVWTGAPS